MHLWPTMGHAYIEKMYTLAACVYIKLHQSNANTNINIKMKDFLDCDQTAYSWMSSLNNNFVITRIILNNIWKYENKIQTISSA